MNKVFSGIEVVRRENTKRLMDASGLTRGSLLTNQALTIHYLVITLVRTQAKLLVMRSRKR